MTQNVADNRQLTFESLHPDPYWMAKFHLEPSVSTEVIASCIVGKKIKRVSPADID